MKNHDLTVLKNVSQQKWTELANKKIFFGHQSVGFNIIDGINDIMREIPQLKLNIQQTKYPNSFIEPILAHAQIGENKVPSSKIYDFKNIITNGIGDSADVAFFKFCYIDIMAHTKVEKIFEIYQNAMTDLSQQYKNTMFVHVTVPLRTVQPSGPKTWIKNILGKPIGGYDDNIKRNQFNEMLNKAYEGKEPIFDLAKAESTFPDGSRNRFENNGKFYYSLIPSYTEDGGHLNEIGQKIIAEQFLLFLSGL